MNYDQQQQQYMMQQGQRMQNSRLMAMPGNMGQQHMQRQQRFTMTMGQPSQQPMQLPPNQYVQGASMQTRPQITMNEALMRLPPEIQTQAQQQISAETNPERKRAIAMNFFTTHRMRMTSSFPNPTTSSILVNVNGSQPVGLQQTNLANNQLIRMGPAQGGVMPQVSIFQGQHQMQQQNMPTVTSGQVTMQRVGAHGYIPQSSIPTTSNQMMQSVPVTHEQQSQAVTIPNYNSPQSIAIPQPSSVGPPVVQQLSSLQQKGPSSVPSAIYAQHHRTGASSTHSAASTDGKDTSSSDEPMYNQLLEQLRTYHEHVKRIIERSRLDGQQPSHIFERLLEIMENRRKVELKLLEKLVGSVKMMVGRYSLCRSLIEIVQTDPSNLPPDAFRTPFPDPWSDLRQYSIRVPDEVAAIVVKTESLRGAKGNQKENETILKRPEIDESPLKHEAEDKSVDQISYSSESANIVVDCFDGSQLTLSQEASEQLRNYSFRFDNDLLPISNECDEVLVLIDNESLLVPPLRLVIPTNYPGRGAYIWQDQWSFDGRCLTDVNVQMEKRMAMTRNSRSISEIIKAWKIASDHVRRIGVSD